jgi:putative inorganic carbon (HCO3(-)) transporter
LARAAGARLHGEQVSVVEKYAHAFWRERAFWGELIGLGLAAPIFYFPNILPAWTLLLGLVLLLGTWLWRRQQLGYWYVRTPADFAFALLLLVLPLSLLAAPPDLRALYAWPRTLILLWNIAFLAMVLVHVRRSSALRSLLVGGFVAAGVIVATAALFGTRWEIKLPLLAPLLDQLPRPLQNVFSGAQDGFSPNQLAGTLLYVFPFALAWTFQSVRTRQWRTAVPLAAGLAVMAFVLLAAQSRAGFAGLAAALLILLLWPRPWGRRLLAGGAALAAAAVVLLPVNAVLAALDSSTKVEGAYGSLSVSGRLEIWARAVTALYDFPWTGIGLGSFRGIVHEVYPLYLIPPDYDIAHAHNFLLQSGLDFGLFGLVAIVALYLLAAWQCHALWRKTSWMEGRIWGLGLLAALLGQAVYSLADVVAMGSKTNLFFWWLLGIVFGLSSGLAVAVEWANRDSN